MPPTELPDALLMRRGNKHLLNLELEQLPLVGQPLDQLFAEVRAAIATVTRSILNTHLYIQEKPSIRALDVMRGLRRLRLDLSRTVARIKVADALHKKEEKVSLFRSDQAMKVEAEAKSLGDEMGLGGEAAAALVRELMTEGIEHQAEVVDEYPGLSSVLDPVGEMKREHLLRDLSTLFTSRNVDQLLHMIFESNNNEMKN